jgi:Tfp pilus assembly protein PilF
MLTAYHTSNWHPLTWLSHGIDYAIWGFNPLGHHLTSVILHGLNTFLVAVLIIRLIQTGQGSREENEGWVSALLAGAVTGLFFGLHPLNVESVAWISQRKNVLYAFFYLLSIFFYLNYNESSLRGTCKITSIGLYPGSGCRTRYYFFCLIFFILALMSKPMAVTLPLVLIILDIYPLKRLHIWGGITTYHRILLEKLPFFALSTVSSVVTLIAQKVGGAIQPLEFHPLDDRFLVGIRAIAFYLYKMLRPTDLAPLYPHLSDISFFKFEYIGSFALVLSISLLCLLSWRKQKVFSMVWAYYLITLLPVIGIIQVGDQAAADRYTYLASLGPFSLIGLGITWLIKKSISRENGKALKKIFPIIFGIAVVLILFSSLTINQIKVWKNSLTLWNKGIKMYPESPITYTNRGIAYYNLGKFEEAIKDFNKAIEIAPYYEESYHMRGKAYLLLDNYQEALINFNKAIELSPESEQFYFSRKLAYKLAIKDYNMSIEQNPQNIEHYINRGVSFAMIDQLDKALDDFNRAISLKPQFSIAYYNRGLVYLKSGESQRAVEDFKTAARLGDTKAQNHLKSKGIGW